MADVKVDSFDRRGGRPEKHLGLKPVAVDALMREHEFDEDTTVTVTRPDRDDWTLLIAYSRCQTFAGLLCEDRMGARAWQLRVENDGEGGPAKMSIGGQETDIAAGYAISADLARKAAAEFLAGLSPGGTLRWDEM